MDAHLHPIWRSRKVFDGSRRSADGHLGGRGHQGAPSGAGLPSGSDAGRSVNHGQFQKNEASCVAGGGCPALSSMAAAFFSLDRWRKAPLCLRLPAGLLLAGSLAAQVLERQNLLGPLTQLLAQLGFERSEGSASSCDFGQVTLFGKPNACAGPSVSFGRAAAGFRSAALPRSARPSAYRTMRTPSPPAPRRVPRTAKPPQGNVGTPREPS